MGCLLLLLFLLFCCMGIEIGFFLLGVVVWESGFTLFGFSLKEERGGGAYLDGGGGSGRRRGDCI